jgi:hypothetical protein
MLKRSLSLGVQSRHLVDRVKARKEMELSLGRLHLGDVAVEEADGVALELLPFGFVAFDIWKARHAMMLKAAVQR